MKMKAAMAEARESDLSTLLAGRVQLYQPVKGYRAGMDAVMLAACLRARPGEHLVELGCGPGAALMSAATRLPEVRFKAYEVEAWAADLARRNAEANNLEDRVEIIEGDIADIKPVQSFDQVFFNPPFFDDPDALRAPSPEKKRAWLSGDAPLPVWFRAAGYLLKGKGYLTLIHRADTLADILAAAQPVFGSAVILPIQPRAERPAKRVIVRLRKGGKAPLKLLPPLLLHEGEARAYSARAQAIYDGAALELG